MQTHRHRDVNNPVAVQERKARDPAPEGWAGALETCSTAGHVRRVMGPPDLVCRLSVQRCGYYVNVSWHAYRVAMLGASVERHDGGSPLKNASDAEPTAGQELLM